MAQRKRKFQNYNYNRNDSSKKPRYEDRKYEIIGRVRSQTGIRSQLVLFHSSLDLPFTILHNAVDRINGILNVTKQNNDFNEQDGTFKFQLSINGEILVEGFYRTEAIAKRSLAELAITELRKSCFSIFRKMQPRDSPKVDLNLSTSNSDKPQSTSTNVGGIGAKMMMQMGWAGKGLGAQEQGRLDIVQPYIQIQRQGLGTKNIVQEVRSVLENYAASKDINSVAFSSEFTKDERAVIHEVARKLNLVSRSYGPNSDRMLVVRSKIKPWDLIYSLLEAGGETEQLKLVLPVDFHK